ncbi:MAG: HD domain-containing protein [Candidatus Hermodarchaeota archaeon]
MTENISPIKVIRDPVHGYISIPKEFFPAIIDTWEFQRLRGIKQLGTAFLTYPGATHTRFEHSLGVFHLGSLVLATLLNKKLLNIPKEKIDPLRKTVQAALLLHDVGHTPLSHVCERFIDAPNTQIKLLKEDYSVILDGSHVPRKHELAGCVIIIEKFKKSLETLNIDLNFLLRMILGIKVDIKSSDGFFLNLTKQQQQIISEILNSPIDVDRLDYIVRDMYFSGANVVALDIVRFIRSYRIADSHLILSKHALDYVPNFIYGREALYNSLYLHHNIIYTDSLIARTIYGALKKGLLPSDFFSPLQMVKKGRDDSSVFNFLREIAMSDPLLSKYSKQLLTREKILKPLWKNSFEYNKLISEKSNLAALLKAAKGKFEAGLIKKFNLNEYELIISIAKTPVSPSGSRNVYIRLRDGLTTFHEIFNESIRRIENPGIFIYSPKDKIQKIIDFINSADEKTLLDIIEVGKQNPTFFSTNGF